MTERPRRVHFVWTGRSFPYFCRVAIESVLVHVPNCEVRLHLFGEQPGGRHLREVASHHDVRIETVDVERLFSACPGGSRPFLDLLRRLPSPAAASNLIRLGVLFDQGGVYLDTDVVVLRDLHDPAEQGAFVGAELVWEPNRRRVSGTATPGDGFRSASFAAGWLARRFDARIAAGRIGVAGRPLPARATREQVNNAVIGARAGAPFVERSLAAALEVDPTIRYALGPSLLDAVARRSPRDVRILPPSRFYAVPPSQSFRLFEEANLELPPDAMLIHLVASNHQRLLRRLDEWDPRFERHDAVFWRAGRQVRSRIQSSTASRSFTAEGA